MPNRNPVIACILLAAILAIGAIGAGAFWTGMIDFVGGASAQDVADKIQASWASLN